MKIKISKRFVKDTQKITDQRILAKIRELLTKATEIQSLSEFEGLKRAVWLF
jgi:hypothetical protein